MGKESSPYSPPKSNVETALSENIIPKKIHIWSFVWRFYALFIFIGFIMSLVIPKIGGIDPMFIKLKPTIIFLAIAGFFLVIGFFTKRGAIYLLNGKSLRLNTKLWKKIHLANLVVMVLIALLNIFVAYFASEIVWVNFKLFYYNLMVLFFIVTSTTYFVLRYSKT